MPGRFVRRQELRVALPLERAMHLFTPVGERLWVDGWEPSFPAGESGDGADPGTVFVTAREGEETFWTVIDRSPDSIRYSRVTPGHTVGTVEVSGRADGDSTVASVTYDLTPVGEAGEQYVRDLAEIYSAYIATWEQLITSAIASGRIT